MSRSWYKPGQNSKGGLMHLHPKYNKVLPLYSIWHEVNNVLILCWIKRRLESCAKWSGSVASRVASNFTPTPWSCSSDFCVVYDLVLTGINFNLSEVNESWSGGGRRFCLTWLGKTQRSSQNPNSWSNWQRRNLHQAQASHSFSSFLHMNSTSSFSLGEWGHAEEKYQVPARINPSYPLITLNTMQGNLWILENGVFMLTNTLLRYCEMLECSLGIVIGRPTL